MEGKFILPIGLNLDGKIIRELPMAATGGDAEKVFTGAPSSENLYTWFGEIISVAVSDIGGEPIASDFIKNLKDNKRIISKTVRQLPMHDVGSLLLQIQRECWDDKIEKQKLGCQSCGKEFEDDIDLMRIPVPETDASTAYLSEYTVRLPRTYKVTVAEFGEGFKDFDGLEYNQLRFRVPILEDAIRHQKVSEDEVLFWKNIAFDTLVGFELVDESRAKGKVKVVATQEFATRRGKLLFDRDFNSKTLKTIRKEMQTSLPSAKFYYEDTCPCPRRKTIPYFVNVANFFSS